ncbi:MAG: hypothetical protein IJC25_00115 [Clostridia bacterium]|nr:hypothetical protein [Clostridia bacterium]
MSRLTLKITAALCSLLLLLTAACNNPETSSQTVSGILNTEYTREKILSQTVAGDRDYFVATQLWATEFVRRNYQSYTPSDVTAVFVSGFAMDENELADFAVGAQIYDVTFTSKKSIDSLPQNTDGSYTLRLQAVYYVDQEGRCVLSGFAYEDALIADGRQLYEFLKADSRLTMQPYPYPVADECVQAYNLSQVMEQRGQQKLSQLYCIGENRFLFLSCDKNAPAGTVDVNFFDLSTGENFADNEAMHLTGVSGYYFLDMTGGEIKVCYNYAEGGAYYCNTFAHDGTVRGKFQPYHSDDDTAVHAVGDSQILNENGSLYLLDDDGERTLLLEGKPGLSEDSTVYRFCGQAGEEAFLFVCFGYEWVEHWGVYDLNTRSVTKGLGHEHPLGTYHGKVYLQYSDGPEFALRTVSLDNLTASPQDIVSSTSEEHYMIYDFSPDGNYLAYGIEEEHEVRVKVLDLRTDTAVSEFLVKYAVGFSELAFGDDDTLHLLTAGHALYDEYLFTYTVPQTTAEE